MKWLVIISVACDLWHLGIKRFASLVCCNGNPPVTGMRLPSLLAWTSYWKIAVLTPLQCFCQAPNCVLDCQDKSRLICILIYKGFQMWHLIIWQHRRQPIICQVRKSLLLYKGFLQDGWNYLSIPKLQRLHFEVPGWVSHSIPLFIMDMITYPCWYWSKSMLVNWVPDYCCWQVDSLVRY